MPLTDELAYRSATDIASAIRAKTVSPVEVLESVIARVEQRNASVNAFVFTAFDGGRWTAVLRLPRRSHRDLRHGAGGLLQPRPARHSDADLPAGPELRDPGRDAGARRRSTVSRSTRASAGVVRPWDAHYAMPAHGSLA